MLYVTVWSQPTISVWVMCFFFSMITMIKPNPQLAGCKSNLSNIIEAPGFWSSHVLILRSPNNKHPEKQGLQNKHLQPETSEWLPNYVAGSQCLSYECPRSCETLRNPNDLKWLLPPIRRLPWAHGSFLLTPTMHGLAQYWTSPSL